MILFGKPKQKVPYWKMERFNSVHDLVRWLNSDDCPCGESGYGGFNFTVVCNGNVYEVIFNRRFIE